MKKLFFPAVFQVENDGFSVFFPDVEGCHTQGDTMSDAYEMSVDALGLSLTYLKDKGQKIPSPSAPNQIQLASDQFLVVIEFDWADYMRKYDTRAVKKTLSIPSWLNQMAIDEGVNFSQILQEALKERLDLVEHRKA